MNTLQEQPIKLTGRLRYTLWDKPWELEIGSSGYTNLWPLVEKFFGLLNGRNAIQTISSLPNNAVGFSLQERLRSESELIFIYIPGKKIWLKKPGNKEIIVINVQSFMDEAMRRLSGRVVTVGVQRHPLSLKIKKAVAVG